MAVEEFDFNESLVVYDRVVMLGAKGSAKYVQIILSPESVIKKPFDEITLTAEAAGELRDYLNAWFSRQ